MKKYNIVCNCSIYKTPIKPPKNTQNQQKLSPNYLKMNKSILQTNIAKI